MSTPEQLFAALLATDAGRPFVTYYDETSGERAELSVRSTANWVAKTHFLLTDELGLGVGDTALIALPPHWISVPALLGCLTAGLAFNTDPTAAAVAFVEPATAPTAALDSYAIAPLSAALGFGAAVPDGVLDYVAAVRPQGDSWAAVRLAAGDDDPCVDARTRGEIVDWAHARAVELGVAEGARVLSTRDWSSPADWLDTLIVPLAVAGSIVFVRNAGEDVVERRISQERVSARI